MALTRRSFLKILGGTAAAVVTAPILPAQASGPLFIPSERLDFGVPRQIITATSLPEPTGPISTIGFYGDAPVAAARMAGTVPMTLLQNEYLTEWGGRLSAGSTVLVDQTTAERWVKNGVAVTGPGAPLALEVASFKVQAERQKVRDERGDGQDLGYWRYAGNRQWRKSPDGPPLPIPGALPLAKGGDARLSLWDHQGPFSGPDLTEHFRRMIARQQPRGSGLQFDDDEFTVPEFAS